MVYIFFFIKYFNYLFIFLLCYSLISQEIEFQCQWRGCLRVKKTGIAPFPSLHRLVRHVKEVHILKNPGKPVPSSERNK